MKMYLLLVLILVSVNGFTSGDHHHDHEAAVESAPHGGILRNALPFKAELVLNQDQAKIYIYNKDLKPLAISQLKAEIKGALGFPKDKKKRELVFKLKDGVYEAKIPGIDKVHRYDLHIPFEAEGTSVVLDFGVDNIH